jgi:phage terminase large subunit
LSDLSPSPTDAEVEGADYADFPEALAFLFEPARYKVAYGGRGGAKTWNFGRALLILASERPLRVLCTREIQKSIRESVHQLLRDQIKALGLEGFYEVLDNEIRGLNGSLFIFAGLRHNVDSIKSKEAVDVVWVEEADTVSAHSWNTLIPTIRKEGSEIWIGFNPGLESSETYQRFVIRPPDSAIVRKVGWQDNPWFPSVLDAERRSLQASDPDAYQWVWEGHPKVTLDGAVFANELRAATSAGRVCSVPYNPAVPVSTFWDLGRRDLTAIWMVQQRGFEFAVLDYYEARGHLLPHYLAALQQRGYVFDTHWLPHDAQNKVLAARHTIEEQVRAANLGKVRIVPKGSIVNRINAARTVFPRCYFDAVKTEPGVLRLRNWRYEVDEETGSWADKPFHDDNSNGADAFTYFAVSMTEAPAINRPRPERPRLAGGWMGA